MAFFGLFGKKSKEEKESLDQGLKKTKTGIFDKISRALVGKSKVDEDVLDGIEEALIASDIGVETTLKIIDSLEDKMATVVVPDYQLSLAIGKEGQNAKLVARLTGCKIDIKA